MRLGSNHIAHRFMTDENMLVEIVESTFRESGYLGIGKTNEIPEEDIRYMRAMIDVMRNDGQKSYYCTNTVIEKLDMLKVRKINDNHDWSVFDGLQDSKSTFILPDNSFFRVRITEDVIVVVYLKSKDNDARNGKYLIKIAHVDRKNNTSSSELSDPDTMIITDMFYKLLCFMFLTDNDEVIIKSNGRFGTKKSGKFINNLPFDVTIVNSRWNTKTISVGKFGVSGHFRLVKIGKGRTGTRIVFVDPFIKNGYTRRAGKDVDQDKTNK